MTELRRRPSLASIAAELGVSTATVSNTYNRPERVSADVRGKVLAAAAKQGYAGPDPAARQLRRGRTDTVGLLLPAEIGYAFRDPATAAFLEGLAGACAQASQNLLLVCSPAGDDDGTQVAHAVVDGFVIYGVAADDPRVRRVAERAGPCVVVDAPLEMAGADWVGPDDGAASRVLAETLIASGHRRIGVISYSLGGSPYSGAAESGRVDRVPGSAALQRIGGIRAALSAGGVGELPVEERPENSAAAGADALHALLTRRPDLTAVCALSDVLAFGALTAARQRGLRIPHDLTVTGFDDVPEAARAGLTTVAQPHIEKGRIAGQLLFSQGPSRAPRRHTLQTVLQMRATSGPPRAANPLH